VPSCSTAGAVTAAELLSADSSRGGQPKGISTGCAGLDALLGGAGVACGTVTEFCKCTSTHQALQTIHNPRQPGFQLACCSAVPRHSQAPPRSLDCQCVHERNHISQCQHTSCWGPSPVPRWSCTVLAALCCMADASCNKVDLLHHHSSMPVPARHCPHFRAQCYIAGQLAMRSRWYGYTGPENREAACVVAQFLLWEVEGSI